MAKYSREHGGTQVYHFDGRQYGYDPVVVIPEADWKRLIKLSVWAAAYSYDLDEIAAIIRRTEEANNG